MPRMSEDEAREILAQFRQPIKTLPVPPIYAHLLKGKRQ